MSYGQDKINTRSDDLKSLLADLQIVVCGVLVLLQVSGFIISSSIMSSFYFVNLINTKYFSAIVMWFRSDSGLDESGFTEELWLCLKPQCPAGPGPPPMGPPLVSVCALWSRLAR